MNKWHNTKLLHNSLCYFLDEKPFRVKSSDSKPPIFILQNCFSLPWWRLRHRARAGHQVKTDTQDCIRLHVFVFIDGHLWSSWVDDIYLYFELDLQKRLDTDVNSIYASARVLLIMSWHLNLKAATVNARELIMMLCNYTVIFSKS